MSDGAPRAPRPRWRPPTLRVLVLVYLGALVGLPLGFVFDRAFAPGWAAVWRALQNPQMVSAITFTARVAAVALPVDVVFGVGASLWIVRRPGPVARVLDTVIDAPLALSPIIVGLMLELAYAPGGWLGPTITRLGFHVIFSYWGVVLASVFVSLPLVSRQVIPVLRAVGDHQEQTAATLGAGPVRVFTTITLRSVRWAAAYGLTLSFARVVGEYGAVLIVSGNIADLTQTLTLNIGSNFEAYSDYQGFVGAVILAAASVCVLAILGLVRARERNLRVHLP